MSYTRCASSSLTLFLRDLRLHILNVLSFGVQRVRADHSDKFSVKCVTNVAVTHGVGGGTAMHVNGFSLCAFLEGSLGVNLVQQRRNVVENLSHSDFHLTPPSFTSSCAMRAFSSSMVGSPL